MADTFAPTENCLKDHVAVCLHDCILVLSKTSYVQTEHISEIEAFVHLVKITNYTLWNYNLWTEQWRKHEMPKPKQLPEISGQSGVVVGCDVYIFGGRKHKNMLWKLTRNTIGFFEWGIIRT